MRDDDARTSWKRFAAFAAVAAVTLSTLVGCATFGTAGAPPVIQEYKAARNSYEDGAYDQAVQQFQAFLDAYAESRLAQPALYYLGKSYEGAGDVENAKATLQQVGQKYPGTTWADLAQRALDQMKQ